MTGPSVVPTPEKVAYDKYMATWHELSSILQKYGCDLKVLDSTANDMFIVTGDYNHILKTQLELYKKGGIPFMFLPFISEPTLAFVNLKDKSLELDTTKRYVRHDRGDLPLLRKIVEDLHNNHGYVVTINTRDEMLRWE